MKTGQLPPHSRGLKDHEIAQTANALRDELHPFIPNLGSLRSRIAAVLIMQLEIKGLRLDAPSFEARKDGHPQNGVGSLC